MKKPLVVLIGMLLTIFMVACSSNDNEESENNQEAKELTLGVTNWTSTVPPTKIVGKILEDMGYEVNEEEADPGVVYTSMSEDDGVDIFMDSWHPAQKQYMERYSDSIESISVSYEDADSGMVVPDYMEDIKDVSDLKGKESLVNNEMIAIEEGDPAMEEMEEMIEFYDLDIDLINSSEAAMLGTAESEIEAEEPILFYGWRPHSMFDTYDLKILENKEAAEEEGLFDGSSIHVVANKKLEDKAPEACQFLSNWSISMEDMESMIAAIDDGDDPDDVTEEWIENHQSEIEEMKEE